jgi:hypothetical protein
VQSKEPFGVGRALGYYEVTIINGGRGKCKVAVGLATSDFSMSKHPGWEPNSYGYHGETGHKIANALSSSGSNGGDAYGPTYGMGDVIGCGILFRFACSIHLFYSAPLSCSIPCSLQDSRSFLHLQWISSRYGI